MPQDVRYYDDVIIGSEIPPLIKGPMTELHIMRWSASTENWHRIHYDKQFAVQVDGLPDILVNGSWKQQVLCQLMKDWLGLSGWLWRIKFQFREMDPKGSTIIAYGCVLGKFEHDGLGYVECEIAIKNQTGTVSTMGKAIGVLPLKGGREVPYPFVSPIGVQIKNW